jgi:WD40 repeat protein
VNCVAFAPDGNTVASGSEGADTTLRLWEAVTGKEIYYIDLKSGVMALAFSRDGTKLAAGCADRTVRLFERATGKERWRTRGHGEATPGKGYDISGGGQRGVSSLVFTTDAGTLISGGYDGTVRLWEVDTGKEVCRFEVPGCKVHCLALSRDNKTLAAGCEDLGRVGYHPVRLWDVPTRTAIHPDTPRFRGMYSNGPVMALAFAPDGKHLAVGGFDSEVRLWDVSTGGWVGAYRCGALMLVQSLAFSPDGGTLAAGFLSCEICSWEAATGKPLRCSWGHSGGPYARRGGVSSVAFSPDGKTLASGGCDKRVRLWEVASGKEWSFGDP